MAQFEGKKITYEVTYFTNTGSIFSYITGDYGFFSNKVDIGSYNNGLINISTENDASISLKKNGSDNKIELKGGKGTISIGNNHEINQNLNNFVSIGEGINAEYNENNYLVIGKYNKDISYSIFNIGWGTSDSARKNIFTVNPESIILKTKDFGILDSNDNELFGVFYRTLEGENKEYLNSRIPLVLSDNKPIYYTYQYKNVDNSSSATDNDKSGIITNISFGGPNNSIGITYTRSNIETKSGSISIIESNVTKYEIPESGYVLISNISQDKNGKITYTYSNIYTPKLSLGNSNYTGNSNNTNQRKDFIVSQSVSDHQITNTYGSFINDAQTSNNTNETGVTKGIIKNISIDSTGKLSYTFKDIKTNSGTDSGNSNKATRINRDENTGSRFLTNISQDENGKITYTYEDFYTKNLDIEHKQYSTNHDFVYGINIDENKIYYSYNSFKNSGTNNALITGVYLEHDGTLTYTSTDIVTKNGIKTNTGENADEITYDNNGIRVIHGISQDKYGNISYTYHLYKNPTLSQKNTYHVTNPKQLSEGDTFVEQFGMELYNHEITNHYFAYTLPTPSDNYTYHKIKVNDTSSNIDTTPQTTTVNVISHIETTNDNTNSKEHIISYNAVTVLTEQGFNNKFTELLSKFNGVIYAGTYNFTGTENSEGLKTTGEFIGSSKLSEGLTTYQCGYIFIASNRGKFMGSSVPVSAGDFLILNSDKSTSELNNLSYWNIINKNFDLRQTGIVDTNKVITNISIHEDGMITYTYIDSTVSSSLDLPDGERTRDNGDVGLPSKVSNKSIRVINSIKQDASGKISYTYQDIYNKFNLQSDTNALSGNQIVYNSVITWSDDSTYTIKNSYVSWWGSLD